MTELFIKLFNMSISASYAVLAATVGRLILKKAPKQLTMILWCLVGLRLVCPFSFESILSLIPSAQTISPDVMTQTYPSVNTGIPIVNNAINLILNQSLPHSPDIGNTMNPLQLWITVFSVLWLVGVIILYFYGFISALMIKRKVKTAVLLQNNVYQSENVISPFILGLFKPKIFIPFKTDSSDLEHILNHENAHIQRRDHLWKPLGFALLALHWFNPLMWLAYFLLCRDIELACDEKAIKKLSCNARADYSQALLNSSVNKRLISVCPLAFGEVSIKKRVTSILNYKKPAFGIIFAAFLCCIAVGICFLTDPLDKNNSGITDLTVKTIDENTLELTIDYLYPTGYYSMQSVLANEGEYCGDGIKEYDGSLGRYRLLFKFPDTEPSLDFEKKFSSKAVEMENSPVKIRVKRVNPEGHGFYLYLGFDTPFSVNDVEYTKFDSPKGAVKTVIKLDKKASANTASLIYGAPMYSFVMEPKSLPDLNIENNTLYSLDYGTKNQIGTLLSVSLSGINLNSLFQDASLENYYELSKENYTWNRVYFNDSWWDMDLTNDILATKDDRKLHGFRKLENITVSDKDYFITKIY